MTGRANLSDVNLVRKIEVSHVQDIMSMFQEHPRSVLVLVLVINIDKLVLSSIIIIPERLTTRGRASLMTMIAAGSNCTHVIQTPQKPSSHQDDLYPPQRKKWSNGAVGTSSCFLPSSHTPPPCSYQASWRIL